MPAPDDTLLDPERRPERRPERDRSAAARKAGTSRSRLLVRPDRSALRLEDSLGHGGRGRPVTRPVVNAPELQGGEVEAGRAYPKHGAPGEQVYLPRWELHRTITDGGEAVSVLFQYRGPGHGPNGNGPVGSLAVWLAAPPSPTATGPLHPLANADVPITAALRYTQTVEGSATRLEAEISLGALRVPNSENERDGAVFRIFLQFSTTELARTVLDALVASDTRLVLRARVPVWERSWNQSVIGSKQPASAASGGVTVARAVSQNDFTKVAMVVKPLRNIAPILAPQPTPPPAAEPTPEPTPAPAEPPVAPDLIRPRTIHGLRDLLPTARLPTGLRIAAAGLIAPEAVRLEAAAVRVEAVPLASAEVMHMERSDVAAAPRGVAIAAPHMEAVAAARMITLSPQTTRLASEALAADPGHSRKLARTDTAALLNAADTLKAIQIKVPSAHLVPQNLLLEDDGEPAWVQTELEATWELPFSFPPGGDFGYIYAIGDTGIQGAPALLVPLAIPGLSGIYQEALQTNRIHLVPPAFRLARQATAPWLPRLSMVAAELLAPTEEGAEPVFQVNVAYTLEPWIPADVAARVAEALGRPLGELSLLLCQPIASALSMQVPGESGEPVTRSLATTDAQLRFTDTLDLDPAQFARFIQILRDEPESGLTGRVELQLLDGTRTGESRVCLALGFEADHLLDSQVIGLDGVEGRWRVRLRNRIESPVRLVECLAFPIEGGTAAPLADSVPRDLLLAPLESVEIVYLTHPPECPLVVETVRVRARPEPNAEGLLRLLILPSGFETQSLGLTIRGHFPVAAGGAEPVTGLRVEFDDETVATLRPASPEATVTLTSRLLDLALGRTEPRCFFRVTNLTASGEGAASGWMERTVGGQLDVAPVIATFADSF